MTSAADIIPLPRGGFLAQTSMGGVQFGIPPETIKDTMEDGVPDIFVVPQYMFFLENGTSLAELEFPIYFHYFFKHQRIRVICTESQQARLETVFRESLFGPETIDLEPEFPRGPSTAGYPDLRAELNHFRSQAGPGRPLALSDVVAFHPFDSQGRAEVGAIRVEVASDFTYTLFDQDQEVARIPRTRPLLPPRTPSFSTAEVFFPPPFGVTTLGAGHGFDPGAMTSGMIIWLNGRGIMVDPPVNSAIDLVGRGVNPKILDSIILTHCHADHDAGTLQKILQEGRITLYTTRTIFNSFLTKSTALTHIPSEVLEESVQFVPLCPGEETNIHGGLFRFHYSLHSIPTLFFEVAHGGKSMVYSSDTHNNPPYIEELFQQGVLDENRRDFLLNFPWDKDVIFHEAGLPPLHTPMEVLTVLPQEIRDRLFLVHVTREMIPAESGLKIAPTGLAATVTLDVPRRRFGPAAELLSVYLDNPQLRSLGPEKTMEFLLIAQAKTFQAGTRIYGAGDADPHCYMVMCGQVDIWVQGERLTTHSRSEIFGEEALFSQEPREREAVAHSDVQMIVLEKSQFRTFIHNTPLEESLRPLPSDRDRMLRTILAANPVLSQLTPSQQTQFIRLVQHRPHAAGEEILLQGEPIPGCFFIHEGEVAVTQGHWEDTTLTAGQVFGIHALIKNDHISAHEFSAATPCDLYFVATADLEDFLAENPGILLQFYHNTH